MTQQHGVGTMRQLAEAGFSERRAATALRNGHLVRLHRGAYALSEQWSAASGSTRHCMRLLAVQIAAPDAVGWAQTAVVGWGLSVRELPALPKVVRLGGAATAVGAVNSRADFSRDEVVLHRDLRLVDKSRAVVETAASSDLCGGLITADSALRDGLPLESLLTVAGSRASSRGRRQLRRTLLAADPGSESWLESLSRGRVLEVGLPMPLCNVELHHLGRTVRCDLLWGEEGVVGECDGKGKYADGRTAATVIWREKRRHEWIESLGFEVARWGYPEVADDGMAVLARVERARAIQRGAGFRWPEAVTARVVLPPAVPPLDRVVEEVKRLRSRGVRLTLVTAGGRRVA